MHKSMQKITSIRVFISSTFDDMQNERDVLVQKVFPVLRNEAERRGITFSYVDLRWGVREGTAAIDVIRTCMSEIENCIPFFIGLIGTRYGWIPRISKKERRLLNNHFYGLEEFLSKRLSLTDIEVRYNLLRNKNHKCNFFYIRNEKDGNANVKFWQFRTKRTCDRKKALDDFIMNGSLGIIHEYIPLTFEENDINNKNCLAGYVYEDFIKFLNRHFQTTEHQGNTSVRYSQESFLDKQKCILTNSVSKLVQRINEWIYGYDTHNPRSSYLLLTGERGVGKKTILSHIVTQRIPNVNFIYHFTGVSRCQETPHLILTDLIEQVCSLHEISFPKISGVETPEELSNILQELIISQKGGRRYVIVITGIDKSNIICDTETLISIKGWLPSCGAQIILSSDSSNVFNEHIFDKKKEVISVKDMPVEDVEEFITQYLQSHYSQGKEKGLEKDSVELIVRSNLLRHPYTLKSFLEELCLCGSPKELSTRISSLIYSGKKGIVDAVLSRVEKACMKKIKEHGGCFEEVLSLLAISNYGLLETEVKEFCNIAQSDWSLLYSNIKPYILTEGYIKLDSYFSERIYSNYMPTNKKQKFYKDFLLNKLINLEPNVQSCYLMEILHLASDLHEMKGRTSDIDIKSQKKYINIIKEKLLSMENILDVYKRDKTILRECLAIIKNNDDIQSFINRLKEEIQLMPINIQIDVYRSLSHLFYEILPIYDIAKACVDNFVELSTNVPIEYKEAILLKIKILISCYEFDAARECLDNNSQILTSQERMRIEADLFYNKKDKTSILNAVLLYEQIMEDESEITNNVSDLSKNRYVELLIKYIYACSGIIGIDTLYGNKAQKAFNEALSVMENIYMPTTQSFFHNKINLLRIKMANSSSIEEKENILIEAEEMISLITEVFGNSPLLFDAYLNIDSMCSKLIDGYSNINDYKKYVNYIEKSIKCSERLHCVGQNITIPRSLESYAALHTLGKTYSHYVKTRPSHKKRYTELTIKYYTESLLILHDLFPNGHYYEGKTYYNMAGVFRDSKNYVSAIDCIERCIEIKCKFLAIEDSTLFNAYRRQIDIYLSELVETEYEKKENI